MWFAVAAIIECGSYSAGLRADNWRGGCVVGQCCCLCLERSGLGRCAKRVTRDADDGVTASVSVVLGRSHMAGKCKQQQQAGRKAARNKPQSPELGCRVCGKRACNVRLVSHLLGPRLSESALVSFMRGIVGRLGRGQFLCNPCNYDKMRQTLACAFYKPKHAQPSSEQTTGGP